MFDLEEIDLSAAPGTTNARKIIIPSCAESHWRPGLAVGGGFEWGFASNWTAKAEYLYVATVGTGASTDHVNVSWARLSEQIFRIDKWSLCRG
jgi:opacity protein-like surface antigen